MYIYSYLLLVQGLLPPSENSIAVNNNNDNNNNSVVGIATCNGLDGPGIECSWRLVFPLTSRHTEPPKRLVQGLFLGCKAAGE